MKNTCSIALLALLMPLTAAAFPDEERASLDLVSSQATSMVLDGDRYLFLSFGEDIARIDTATWALASDQVPALADLTDDDGPDLTGDAAGLAIRGNTLFASQSDGDLITVDLDQVASEPKTTDILTGTLGPLVADTESGGGDDQLYILDKSNNAVLVYDVSEGKSTSIPLVNSLGQVVSPISLVFVPFPTASSSGTTDRVYVTTNSGLVFVVNEGGTSTAATITLSATNKDLPAASVTPDGSFLLVLNATDTKVHVINTSSNAEVTTISLTKNAALKGIVVTDVKNADDVYAYVTGSSGISVIDLDISGGSFGTPTVIDFNDEGSGDTEDDPLSLDSIPGLIAASSGGDGSVYTSNSDAGISVISDNPFVVLSATSLGSSALTTGSSFTITFQSDEAGTYRVLVGGDIDGSGTEVASGTVETADTDVTTPSISYDASVFAEGNNRIFVFVTDAEGNVGRDSVDITVDTPPPEIEIVSTGFGNEKVFVAFTRLTASDIDHYNIYVATTAAEAANKVASDGTLSQPASGDTVEAKVEGLLNGVTYFLAVDGVDSAGNVGPRTTTLADGSVAQATPERTLGLAEAAGESGCSLTGGGEGSGAGLLWLGVGLFVLAGVRRPRFPMIFLVTIFFSTTAVAEELTPQWWSLELKGGAWMPIDTAAKDFLGGCCDPMGGLEFGFLYRSKFGLEVGAGYIGAGGTAVGASSGAVSGDRFDFMMIPFQNSFTFRADFKEDQFLVPYVKAGLDYLFYRESLNGAATKGLKLGLHTAGGLQILMDKIDELSDLMEGSLGVNDIYLTLETRYAWVNGFGGSGVDLSHLAFSAGFLFEF